MTTHTGRDVRHEDATYYAVPRRRRPWLKAGLWSLFLLGTFGAAAALFANQYGNYALSNPGNNSLDTKLAKQQLAPEPANLPDKPINILVLGSDSRGNGQGQRSDTLILMRLDFKRSFISQLSFPRDLYVQIPGFGPGKINNAFATGGTARAIQTVKQLTGEDIQYFFNVDFQAFRRLVNDAGGVFLDVDRHYFNDNTQAGENFEQLDIKPGYQLLRGSDALDYVRYRHFDSDYARIARQQLFLAELKRSTRSARGIDNIVDAVHSDVTTNLKSVSRLRKFLQFGLSIDKDRIARYAVPVSSEGTRGGAFVSFYNDQKLAQIVDSWKNPDFTDADPSAPAKSDPSKVIVAVYNGSGVIGRGRDVATALEAKGYKVLLGSNAPNGFYSSTAVYYAPNKREDARALAPWFGSNASVGERREGFTADADVIVVVGSDYTRLKKPVAKAGTASKAKPSTVATQALKGRIQDFRRQTGSNFLVPTHLPVGAQVVYVRRYNVIYGDRQKPNAITIVLRLPGTSKLGGSPYATITQTTMKDPPIVKTATGAKNGFATFYDGKTMQRLLWQKGNVTYWVTNSLDGSLSDATIRDMARFMIRPARVAAVVGKGVAVPVVDTGRTP